MSLPEYNWSSPGGLYVVPTDFKQRFLKEFPEYRIRWSLKDQRWMIEQRCGRGALPPLKIDPADDGLIRAKDGYWLVMAFQPGDRMACPGTVNFYPRTFCNWTMKVATRKVKESVCGMCRFKGRDGRYMTSFWPFDETLIERLRETDPLRGGIQRARAEADLANVRRLSVAESKRRDAVTSIDQVDYRWLSGIASNVSPRRQVSKGDFT